MLSNQLPAPAVAVFNSPYQSNYGGITIKYDAIATTKAATQNIKSTLTTRNNLGIGLMPLWKSSILGCFIEISTMVIYP